ncbi:MAG: PH domain-containing protein [Bacillota bacterium]
MSLNLFTFYVKYCQQEPIKAKHHLTPKITIRYNQHIPRPKEGSNKTMKYYQRKLAMANVLLILSVLMFLSSILQFYTAAYATGVLQIFVSVLSFINYRFYRKPYLGIGEGKILINYGLRKKEILLKDITSLNESTKHMVINYNQGSSVKKFVIIVPILKDKDKEMFLRDIRRQLQKSNLATNAQKNPKRKEPRKA